MIATFALTLTVFFTFLFLYANTTKGVQECGCFGDIEWLQLTPVWFYIKNTTLSIFLIYIVLNPPATFADKNTLRIASAVLIVCAFFTGYSFHGKRTYSGGKKHYLMDMPTSKTALQNIVELSADSTYAVCFFSYKCSSCWDYFENLRRYENSDKIDRVIAVSVGKAGNESADFASFFNFDFEIREASLEEVKSIAKVSPTVLYISNDTIRHIIMGAIPCLYNLEKNYFNSR